MAGRAVTVVPYEQRDTVDGWVGQLVAVRELGEVIAQTEFVPRAYRNNPAAVAAAILAGRELGIGPMTALQHLYVIEGRPAMSSQLMRALVLAHGHSFTVDTSTGKTCTITGKRAGQPTTMTVTWDESMARVAGLWGRAVWRAYPRSMLLARATAELCRAIFPDVIGGMTLSVEEATDLDGEVEPPTPPRTRTVRRARTIEPGGRDSLRGEPVPPPPAGRDALGTPDAPPAPPLPDADRPAPPEPIQNEPLPFEEPPPPPEPPPEEEQPAAARNEGPSKLTSAQRATIMTQLTGLRLKDPPGTRHRVLSGLLGRRVTSTNQLTRDDASAVIDTLARYLEEQLTPLQFEELVAQGLARFGG